MIAPVIQPLVRRAILDLLEDVGGEHNDDVLSVVMAELGHRVARRDVRTELTWLAERNLVKLTEGTGYIVAEIEADGRDVSRGRLTIDGVSRHRTGG